MANGLHDMNSTHDISLVGLNRNVIAETYQRLGCQVEYDFGLVLPEDVKHLLAVTDVGSRLSASWPACQSR